MNQYRAHLKAARKSGAPGVFEVMARGFTAKFGAKRVNELKPYDFDQWVERQTQWNPTSKAHAGTLILAAVPWARKKGLIETDPIGGRIDLSQPVLGRDARMSEDMIRLMLWRLRPTNDDAPFRYRKASWPYGTVN